MRWLVGVWLVGCGGGARPEWAVDAHGVALGGYDPVSYFPEGGSDPDPGDASLTATHEGRTYRFEDEAHRAAFLADPARYEPAYGGWCAYAVANGYKFEVDPESWRVEDGRLFLFYRGRMGDAQAEFVQDGVAAGIANADRNWPKIRQE